jgi:glucose-6-phosphate dehydrogenase assembly protein OpcA
VAAALSGLTEAGLTVDSRSEAVWAEQDTGPSAIDAALRRLLAERHAEDDAFVPARVCNLVAIVDRDWRGEIENRLEKVGRFHPSRTIVCAVEKRRDTIDAVVSLTLPGEHKPGEIAVGAERVELTIGEGHLERLETIVDPLIVPDLVTVVWSPHGHDNAVDALIKLAGVVLIDSVMAPDPAAALRRAHWLTERAYVVDLAWLRSLPWRERVASTFDPPQWRPSLREITSVTVRHHPESVVSAALFVSWLASRLGWQPAPLEEEDGGQVSRARASGRKVKLRAEPDQTMPVHGLAGVAVETASGMKLSLFRGAGGLQATRKLPGGKESSWVVLGASRGEAGILGEGIRQALLRDPTYGPALTAACEMLAS